MQFVVGTEEQAKNSEFSSYVSEPGCYDGIISSAVMKKFDSGAEGFEIIVQTQTGDVRDMIITKKKDGTPSDFGMNKIQGGLLRVVGLKEGQVVQPQTGPDGSTYFPDLIGRQVGVCVNIELTGTEAKQYTNTRITHFYNVANKTTGSGKTVASIEPTLKVIDSVVKAPPVNTTAPGTPAPTANPFAK